MDLNNMVKVSKDFLKESFSRGLEKKAWILYKGFEGEYDSGMTLGSAAEVDEYYQKGCKYYIEL